MFVHAASDHMELRIESHHDPVVRRHAVLKVDGEVLSDMTFDPCLTSTVSDTRRGGRAFARMRPTCSMSAKCSVYPSQTPCQPLRDANASIGTTYCACLSRVSGPLAIDWPASPCPSGRFPCTVTHRRRSPHPSTRNSLTAPCDPSPSRLHTTSGGNAWRNSSAPTTTAPSRRRSSPTFRTPEALTSPTNGWSYSAVLHQRSA